MVTVTNVLVTSELGTRLLDAVDFLASGARMMMRTSTSGDSFGGTSLAAFASLPGVTSMGRASEVPWFM